MLDLRTAPLRHWLQSGFRSVATILAFAPFAVLMSWGFLWNPGLPRSDDNTMNVEKVEMFRRAYRAGDWFPVWTPFGAHAHGSPVPFLYHRLYPQLLSLLALRTGALHAVKLSIPLLLVVGAAGMRRLCLSEGVRGWVAWGAGLLFISADYVFTDWCYRGAISEFMAFMLVPWALSALIGVIEGKGRAIWLALTSALLFYAHTVIFYYFALVGVAMLLDRLVLSASVGWRASLALLRRVFVAGLLLACAIGPYVVALLGVMRYFRVGTFAIDWARREEFASLLVSPHLSWWRGSSRDGFPADIGRWILLSLALLLVMVPTARTRLWRWGRPLVVMALCFVPLLHPDLRFAYAYVPGAAKIQFPYRLLNFIVPTFVVGIAVAVEYALRSSSALVRWAAPAMAMVATAGQLTTAARWQRPVSTDESTPAARLADQLERLSDTNDHFEYLPEGVPSAPPETPFLRASPGCTLASAELTGGSVVSETHGKLRHLQSFRFTVHGTDCVVHLSAFMSPLLVVDVPSPGRSYASSSGTLEVATHSDWTVVRVRERGILELAAWVLLKRAGFIQAPEPMGPS